MFLPTTKKECEERGWESVDVVVVTGDAYVDHPSFGHAVVARLLEKLGLRVAVLSQPNWQDDLRDFKKFGPPNLFFAITAGCMDTIVSNYTGARRKRSDDAYTPAGAAGFRPDDASIVYSKIIKNIFPDTPIVLGGIEASLRRLSYYHYIQDKLLPSVLIDSGADLLIYGMGERPLSEMVTLLKKGVPFSSLKTIAQSCYVVKDESEIAKNKNWTDVKLHSHQECLNDSKKLIDNTLLYEREFLKYSPIRFIQPVDDLLLVVNPPCLENSWNLDETYKLPFERKPHPKYKKRGDIPAFEMIKNSINIHRGCFGGCNFCAITAHQGKRVVSRSEQSILSELEEVVRSKDFNGVISDLGGPSANMYKMGGNDKTICDKCERKSCIHPSLCKNLNSNHGPLIDLLRKVESHSGVKHLYIGSGIRYDMFDSEIKNNGRQYWHRVITKHTSGRLKVAPECGSAKVLSLMRKPSFDLYEKAKADFDNICKKEKLSYQIIPYMMSNHPGESAEEMLETIGKLYDLGHRLEQVQEFTPTPMTTSTLMYYTGMDPYKKEKITVVKKSEERKKIHSLFFWYRSENKSELRRILKLLKRPDLEKKFL